MEKLLITNPFKLGHVCCADRRAYKAKVIQLCDFLSTLVVFDKQLKWDILLLSYELCHEKYANYFVTLCLDVHKGVAFSKGKILTFFVKNH